MGIFENKNPSVSAGFHVNPSCLYMFFVKTLSVFAGSLGNPSCFHMVFKKNLVFS